VSANDVGRAAALLRAGELVAFPTETVYGLGADASNPAAVAKIFAAKGRPADHPLIVHLPGGGHLDRWARDIPGAAFELAEAFWPGPLTLILKRQPQVSDAVTGGQDTGARRIFGQGDLITINAGTNGNMEVGREYFVRQMKNMKASMPVSLMTGKPFDFWAFTCGALLARAHARCGDAARIAGYCGDDDTLVSAGGFEHDQPDAATPRLPVPLERGNLLGIVVDVHRAHVG